MLDILQQLGLFSAKALIVLVFILALLVGILAIFSRGKEKISGVITIANLNEKFTETTDALLEEILTKDELKKRKKEKKLSEKNKKKSDT
jgi:serine protease SohB